jgi:hypothetical protein
MLARLQRQLLLAAVWCVAACGEGGSAMIGDLETGVSYEMQWINAAWQSSFPGGTAPDGTALSGRSELRYNRMPGSGWLGEARCTLFSTLGLESRFSLTRTSAGTGSGTDSDRIIAGDDALLFSESQCSCAATPFLAGVRLVWPLVRQAPPGNWRCGLQAGYERTVTDIRMTDGRQTVSLISGLPPAGAELTGLDATYRFAWDTLALGIDGRYTGRGQGSFQCSAAALHSNYRGEGYWNLRAYTSDPSAYAWRNEAPNFTHTAADGWGVAAGCAYTYRLTAAGTISVGYAYRCFIAQNGTETIYWYNPALAAQQEPVTLTAARQESTAISLTLLLSF